MTKKLLAVAGIAMLLAAGAQAKNKGNFKKEHPRRAEVIHRENKDKRKFDRAEGKGKITGRQEKKLDREENRIRRQERAEAKANGGHITKGEKRQLNREEHRVEKQEKRMEKKDAAAN
ncbi:MAG: hypothetical protein HY077_04585 [Elusimicrobia bacterium]|nr:hypothetical protein [Elusimicrobiota bacterium]